MPLPSLSLTLSIPAVQHPVPHAHLDHCEQESSFVDTSVHGMAGAELVQTFTPKEDLQPMLHALLPLLLALPNQLSKQVQALL